MQNTNIRHEVKKLESYISLQDDYKQFLINTAHHESLWVSRDELKEFYLKNIVLEKEDDKNNFYDFHTFYGTKDLLLFCEKGDIPGLNFFAKEFLSFCYPIGRYANGDPMIQISAGNFTGEIYLINHEAYGLEEDLVRNLHKKNSEILDDFQEILSSINIKDIDFCNPDHFLMFFSHPMMDSWLKVGSSFSHVYEQIYSYFKKS